MTVSNAILAQLVTQIEELAIENVRLKKIIFSSPEAE
jgi:hypothetical protein